MEPGWLVALVVASAAVVLVRSRRRRSRARSAVLRTVSRLPRPRRRPPDDPSGRPIEVIAADARRLCRRVHDPPRGTSYAKYQAWQWTYDHVLSEGCRALEIPHLLDVLAPGEERDRERQRVETLLWLAGLRIDTAV